MSRKNVNTTIDKNLYSKIQVLAVQLTKNANDLIEEGMDHTLEKYSDKKNHSNIQTKKRNRKSINTTLDEDLYTKIKILAVILKIAANNLIEEGMEYILEKYDNNN